MEFWKQTLVILFLLYFVNGWQNVLSHSRDQKRNQNQPWLAHPHFPCFVLIGSLHCSRVLWLSRLVALVLMLRHLIENRSDLQISADSCVKTVILSFRGLLLPKIVVDDFGGKRSDAGMLGSGIYFASSARLEYYLDALLCWKIANFLPQGNIKAKENWFTRKVISFPCGFCLKVNETFERNYL